MKTTTYQPLSCIHGEWIALNGKSLPVINPSSAETITEITLANSDNVNQVVQSAKTAYADWSETPVTQRAQYMFKYKQLLEENFDAIAHILTSEHGKTIAEAKGELRRGVEVVDFSCGIPMLMKGETLANTGGSVDYESHRFPIGVCVGITPFNFPAMIPLWMYPIAVMCGNTFILKPSEQTPLTAARLVELFQEAGFPPGVLNLLHGDKESVDNLLEHPDVKAISFVGSTPVAKAIYQKGTANGKRVQAAGGAKNHLVLLPDAPVEAAVGIITGASFGCAGERCMATASILATPEAAGKFMDPLKEATAAFKVGPTDRDESVNMGPLISKPHQERVLSYIEKGANEGATILQDGRNIKVDKCPNGFYVGPTILDNVQPEHTCANDEIFGPVLSVIRTPNLDAAIEQINKNPYGNAAVILTGSGRAGREFRHRVNCGMVGINVGVPAPMALFPFTGWNDSFFGDLHIQGTEGIEFYTHRKVCISRWYQSDAFIF
jgi:malonate-semialdehyde dehydrogenase (acetylating)/methylmalonate-semialdehyde dehydrogenase